jgi:hypothetical protein
VLVTAWLEDNAPPIKVFLPLQHGFLQLDTHKLRLGTLEIECGSAVERFVRTKRGGIWQDLGWSVSWNVGDRRQVGLRRKGVVNLKNWELHEAHLDV